MWTKPSALDWFISRAKKDVGVGRDPAESPINIVVESRTKFKNDE